MEVWFEASNQGRLILNISEDALMAASDGMSGEGGLRAKCRLVDARVSGLLAAVNGERIVGFPNGRLFLDSVEHLGRPGLPGVPVFNAAHFEICLSPECCLRTAEAAPIRENTPADHRVRLCVLSPLTKRRFNSGAAPTEISTYRQGFPLAGGTGARCSSIPS
jgi:hypothetical protein